MKQSNQSSERVRGPSSATGYIRARSGLSPNAGVRCVPDGVIILYCHVLERSEMARGNNKKKKDTNFPPTLFQIHPNDDSTANKRVLRHSRTNLSYQQGHRLTSQRV